MSTPVQFKFTKDGITRRVAFTQLPSWLEIAAKLEPLYAVPVEHVAVSYTDADGDEVTLSSQEELEDYYRAESESDPPFRRLSVVDLSVIRNIEDKPLPDTPSITHRLRDTPSHNTFGTIPFHQDAVEDDWQRIPGFSPFYGGDISSGSGNDLQFARIGGDSTLRSSMTRDTPATHSRALTPTPGDKGKAREVETTSSTDSVLANDTPQKYPVHVYQVSGHSIPRSSGTAINIQEVPPSPASPTHDAPDPPLPELEPPTPTLTGDVAAFLSMFSAMFSQNPQLTASLGNMMQNIGNGAYWAVHRDQLNRAAEEVRRSTTNFQTHFNTPETDASTQIAEAIGNIVRSFTQNVPPRGDGDEHGPRGRPGNLPHPPHGEFPHHGPFPPPPPPGWFPPGPPPHHGSFHPHFGFPPSGPGFFGRGRGRGGQFHWGRPGRHGHHGHHGPEGPEPHRRRRREEDSHSDSSGESADDAEADVSMYGVNQKMSPGEMKAKLLAAKAEYKALKAGYRAEKNAQQMNRHRSKTADVYVNFLPFLHFDEPPADLYSSSEVAEAAAKVESMNVDATPSAGPANQSDPLLISQGRGQFPSLEMVSVPRRHHTISGGTLRGSRHVRDASGSTNPTATVEVRRARLVRKLSDVRLLAPYSFHTGDSPFSFQMGFEGAKVENRVSIHIPEDQTVEERSEDAIVANVVDELLRSEGDVPNESPTTPRAN